MSNVLCMFCGWTHEQAYEELDRIYKLDPDSEYVIYDV